MEHPPIYRVPCAGEPKGPCVGPCGHALCAFRRLVAFHPCHSCGLPLGSGTYYLIDTGLNFTHVDCRDPYLLFSENLDIGPSYPNRRGGR